MPAASSTSASLAGRSTRTSTAVAGRHSRADGSTGVSPRSSAGAAVITQSERRSRRRLGLVEHRHAGYGTLSGGQKQRLCIALALVGRPRIAVLDELTTGLDPQARRDTWSLIEGVRDSGVTVLLVTHFMDEAERLCDRVAIIDHGRVVGLDRPAALVSTVAGEQSLCFAPSHPLDDGLLLALDDVTAVRRHGGEVAVTGNGNVIQAVVVTLHREGITPDGVRIEQHRLEDVFVTLTGHHLEDPAVREVPS